MTTNQSLPPGWRLEALGPSAERRECGLRITTAEGHQITFTHKPFQFACDITRQLQAALSAQAPAKDAPAPFRIARPEQLRVARDRHARPGASAGLQVPHSARADGIEVAELDTADAPIASRLSPGVEL